MKRRRSVRDAVLKAAVDLVESEGAGMLTLDAVASRAGVSKGGLLHHFKSKEALLTAMMGQLAQTFEEERQAAVAVLNANASDSVEHEVELMTTYLERAFAGLGARNKSAMALFAVAAHQPELMQPIRDYFAERTEDVLKHMGNPRAVLSLSLLADGLWLFDALGIPPFTGKLREEVRDSVIEWAQTVIRAGRDGRIVARPAKAVRGKTTRPSAKR
jgi:AcrR family transcriptional regulator